MRKILSVLIVAVMLIATCGASEPVKASGGEYAYREYDDGAGTKKAWFINGKEIEGNPEVIEEQGYVIIETTPDESCADYLATFYEPTTRVTVCSGVTVTFGSLETKASIQWLTINDADVTVYAEEGEFSEEDGSLPGSVYGVSCYNGTLDFNGNIQYLCLGDEFMYGEDEEKVNAGDIVVNGSVYNVEWHTTTEYAEGQYYKGFTGNASVSGEVGRIVVYEIRHSNVLDTDIKATVGEGWERIPSFTITDGILSEEAEEYIDFFEPDTENFYYEYAPAGDEDGNWLATARYLSGAETGVSKMITAEEMQTILESGTGRISISGWNNPDINIGDYDLSELKVQGGKITVNNITTPDGKGMLQVDSYGRDDIDITVNGDVDYCKISFTRFNENMSIDVNGTIEYGQVYKFSMQSDFPIYLGEFTSTDMPLFVDGIWNPDLFLKLGNTEYHPVDDTLLEDVLGLESTTNQSGEEISEMADMFVDEMKSDTLEGLGEDDDFQACVDEFKGVDVLTGLDIKLEKFDYNETTGEVSNQEVVTELADKDLAITVKVPKQKYDKNKKYIIVREHDNNGKKEMDVLVPTQDGDRLTFKTNKFSSFILVEVENEETIVTQEGWQKNDNGWWYRNSDGSYPKDGWKQISDKWYAFDSRGYMREGWYRQNESWYYLQPNSGHMVSGWQYINSNLYYFTQGGVMATGWQYIDDTFYYFTSGGALAKGWQYIDSTFYYFTAEGKMVTGWQQIGGVWYCFKASGEMTTGWFRQNNTWYYLKPNGEMAVGWLNLNGTWYYLESNGAMATGWVDRNGTWYYFYSNGAMAADTWIGDYYVNSSGAWVR